MQNVMAEQQAYSDNSLLLDAREQNVPRGVVTAHPLVIERARGSEVWDVEGNRYLDFVGGIGVLNVGHNHPAVVKAVTRQLGLASPLSRFRRGRAITAIINFFSPHLPYQVYQRLGWCVVQHPGRLMEFPLSLLTFLSPDALVSGPVTTKLKERLAEIEAWKQTSIEMDFPEEW